MMINRLISILILVFFFISASAGFLIAESNYSIKEMTPAVKAALEHRHDRHDKLREYKQKGLIGETNRGYVQPFDESQEVKTLVEAENHDRKIIYETIAEQNGIVDAMEEIEKVFADVKKDKAAAGDKIQNEDGSWTTK